MLHIRFGDMDQVAYGPRWFKYNYDISWFQDPFVRKMIEEVDKTRYIDGYIFESPVLGPIPPEKLSGGVRTLIMIYEMPDKVFDATSCGQNCAHMLLEIGKRKDVTVNLRYFMPMNGLEPFELTIDNTGMIVSNNRDYTLCALDCLDPASAQTGEGEGR